VFAFHAPRFLSGSGVGPRHAMEGWPAPLLTHAASDGRWVKRPRIFRNSARSAAGEEADGPQGRGRGGAMRSRPLWQLCDTAPERKRGRAAWSKTRSGQSATPLNRGLVGLNGRLVGLPFATVSREREQRRCQLVGVQRPWDRGHSHRLRKAN
jgi:hypothetical protein